METYAFNIIPYECTTGYDSETGEYSQVPVVTFSVSWGDDSDNEITKEYLDYQHQPIMIPQGRFSMGDTFEISVNYKWFGSPRRDFTVKAYSYDGREITDEEGDTNMLHCDGKSPSEFEYMGENWSDLRADDDESSSGNRFTEGYTGCLDTALGATDSYGDGCEWYVADTYCGMFDDSDFETDALCCSCGGGCYDSNDGETDDQGYGCEYYNTLPHMCGEYDTSDFEANDMCCACQTFDQWEASVSESYYYEYSYDYSYDYEYEEESFEEEIIIEESSSEYEIDEDFDFEITDVQELYMAIEFYQNSIQSFDLDNEDYFGDDNSFNFDVFPDSVVGILFSTAELDTRDVEYSNEVSDDEEILYPGHYYADGLEDNISDEGLYHWFRFYYIPPESDAFGESAVITDTLSIADGVNEGDYEFTYTLTLREGSADD